MIQNPSICTLLLDETAWVMLSYHRWRLSQLRSQADVPSAEDITPDVDIPLLLRKLDALDQRLERLQAQATDPEHDNLRTTRRVKLIKFLRSGFAGIPKEKDLVSAPVTDDMQAAADVGSSQGSKATGFGPDRRTNDSDDSTESATAAELRSEVARLQQRVSDLSSQKAMLLAVLDSEHEQCKDAEEKLAQALLHPQSAQPAHDETVRSLQSEVHKLFAGNTRLRDAVQALKAVRATWKREREGLASSLAEAQDDADGAREDIDTLRWEGAQREAALRAELDAAREDRARTDAAHRAEVDSLQEAHAGLQAELDKLRREADVMRAAVVKQGAVDMRKRRMDSEAGAPTGAGPSKRARGEEDDAESAEGAADPGTPSPADFWYFEQQRVITRLQTLSEDLQVRLATSDAQRVALQAGLTDTAERLAASTREHEDSISHVRTELQKARAQAAARDKDVTQAHKTLREVIAEHRTQCIHLRNEANIARAEAQERHSALSREAAALREECVRLRGESEKARAEQASLRGRLTNLLAVD
ncbi:hypothetical protein PsYK624_154490 [Phanerochaete sordida]|uniref:Uncharacterized protein n=1 Tax=Phanerochaete sordida TaxID=48140 RepID=A0A9P3GPB1_9APHY|nr:hypothetical protein PsYK624_154490 [Phanerochaete sordida]